MSAKIMSKSISLTLEKENLPWSEASWPISNFGSSVITLYSLRYNVWANSHIKSKWWRSKAMKGSNPNLQNDNFWPIEGIASIWRITNWPKGILKKVKAIIFSWITNLWRIWWAALQVNNPIRLISSQAAYQEKCPALLNLHIWTLTKAWKTKPLWFPKKMVKIQATQVTQSSNIALSTTSMLVTIWFLWTNQLEWRVKVLIIPTKLPPTKITKTILWLSSTSKTPTLTNMAKTSFCLKSIRWKNMKKSDWGEAKSLWTASGRK